MELELQELINKLIEKGWKPRGIYTSLIVGYGLVRCEEFVGSPRNEWKSYRELLSIESGFWQFVCENGMIKSIGSEIEIKNLNEGYGVVRDTDYQYRLIESALRDESELEDFLLSNIKVEGN